FGWHDGANSLRIIKQGWRVPFGTGVPFMVQFDENKPHEGSALGQQGLPNQISVNIGDELFATMLQELTDSSTMRISVPDGDDRGWSVKLDGAQKVLRTYMKCTSDLEKKNAVPQPHLGGGKKEKNVQEDRI